jgi:hypothetical protein
MTAKKPAAADGKVQGEGDHDAARRFQEAERSWVETGPAERKAREQARHGGGADPHTEENLDEGLDETFPASDPVSIHPGSD